MLDEFGFGKGTFYTTKDGTCILDCLYLDVKISPPCPLSICIKLYKLGTDRLAMQNIQGSLFIVKMQCLFSVS